MRIFKTIGNCALLDFGQAFPFGESVFFVMNVVSLYNDLLGIGNEAKFFQFLLYKTLHMYFTP